MWRRAVWANPTSNLSQRILLQIPFFALSPPSSLRQGFAGWRGSAIIVADDELTLQSSSPWGTT